MKRTIVTLGILILLGSNNLEATMISMRKTENPKTTTKKADGNETIKTSEKADISISKAELDIVADKIFKNEAGGKKEYLVHWNTGENFPSLGIGHFIWYKAGEKGNFEESFPSLVQYFREKGVKLPKIIEENQNAPWKNREELLELKSKGNKDIEELTEFLYNTKDIQIEFIFKRLEASLEKMLASTNDKENVKKQFYRMAKTKNGLYPLIDYVNFKGEGTNPSEGYNGEGWGLLQVLENMKGSKTGQEALNEFSDSAKFVLERRVKNSDPKRNEQKWLPGWFNRCNTYKENY